MEMNIYFAGSISGAGKFKKQQQRIVRICEDLGHTVVSRRHAFQMTGEVDENSGERDQKLKAKMVFERDLWWLMRKCDAVVAELSVAAYGLGFEMGLASVMGLPILGLVNDKAAKLSGFVKGNTFKNYKYEIYNQKTLRKIIGGWFEELAVFAKGRKGLYIAFEGLNQCGKGTQVELLINRLKQKGFPVWHCWEPGTTWLGQELRDLLQVQTEEIPVTRAEVGMLMAQRSQLVEKEIKKHLQLGEVVISDRSDGTGLAFQGMGRKQEILRMAVLSGYAVDQVHPDVVIYLQMPVTELMFRGFSEVNDRHEHEDVEFHERCRLGYEEVLRLDELAPPKTWYGVDALGKPEEVHERVWKIVNSKLPPSPKLRRTGKMQSSKIRK